MVHACLAVLSPNFADWYPVRKSTNQSKNRALISHAIMSQLVPALWGPFLRPWQLQAELGRHQTSLLGAFTLSFHLIQWSGYFIAFYDIVKSERRISNAASLRGGLTAMASAIGDGAPVEDTTCLSAELWNKFLWEFLKR